jgi:hypothetical protein
MFFSSWERGLLNSLWLTDRGAQTERQGGGWPVHPVSVRDELSALSLRDDRVVPRAVGRRADAGSLGGGAAPAAF